MKYRVHLDLIASCSFDIEADSIDEAVDKAVRDGYKIPSLFVSECNAYRVTDETGNEVEGDPYL